MPEARVSDIKVRKVVTASPEETAFAVACRLSRQKLGTVIVVDTAGRPLGIATDRDLMERCIVANRDPQRTSVSAVMTDPVIWVRDDATLDQALEQMARLGVRRLPVIDERERLVGILALDDVLMSHFPADGPIGRVLRRGG